MQLALLAWMCISSPKFN